MLLSATDGSALRARLADAHVMLVFTPHLCGARDPLAVLDEVLEHVDVVQVRPKPPGRGPSGAREVHDWCARVLDVVAARPALDVPVLVNDRVDVAAALGVRGCAGVHLGRDDCPPAEARALLGPAPLVGLSTHTLAQVAAAAEEPVDYLGFGPFAATATKGYARGLGAERCWVASSASALPVFPIGGIGLASAEELTTVRRAAVGAALLAAERPGEAARALRALLLGG